MHEAESVIVTEKAPVILRLEMMLAGYARPESTYSQTLEPKKISFKNPLPENLVEPTIDFILTFTGSKEEERQAGLNYFREWLGLSPEEFKEKYKVDAYIIVDSPSPSPAGNNDPA
jgi:hypothetical protein